MGIISAVFGKFSSGGKNAAQSRMICKKLHDTHVKYASIKNPDGEDLIIGRDGHLNIVDDGIIELTFGVLSAFRFRIDELSVWEFMSLDGAVFSGTELNSSEQKTFTVYYDKHLT